jgi:hypothetical protein
MAVESVIALGSYMLMFFAIDWIRPEAFTRLRFGLTHLVNNGLG